MGIIAISGQPGCRDEEIARLTAHRLRFDLLTQSRLEVLVEEEFGRDVTIPDRAYQYAVMSILGRLAGDHHLVLCLAGSEMLARHLPPSLRVQVIAPEARRVGVLMLDRQLDRPAARALLTLLQTNQGAERRKRFGRAIPSSEMFDLVVNSESLTTDQIVDLIESTVLATGLAEQGLLSSTAQAQLEFKNRLKLARHKIVAPGRAALKKKVFVHPSEQIFANLLDFYRVAWEYEPRTFPIRYDHKGHVIEAFTPDFYLPEFDLYVELTTMKQSLVTKKNRKVRMLRELYPGINIQVFYEKDFQNLVFKYGLAERLVNV
jgi:hypothetical protein